MIGKKIINGLVAVSLLLSGCKKDLDLKPTDSTEEDKAFITVGDIQKGLNAAYAYYGGRVNTMYISSVVSDETKFGPDNGGSGQFSFRLQYNSDNVSGAEVTAGFYSFYSLIDQINRVLANVDVVKAANPSEEAQRPFLKAQLLALRAIGHFELLEEFCDRYDPADPLGVPVMTSSCITCQPARNTVAEVITQIESDFTAAKDALPDISSVDFNDLELNKISITAFQARVALYKREWQKAADYASTVINSGIKPLVTGTEYEGIWTDDNTNETLFRLRYENSGTVGGQWTISTSVIFSPSDKLTEQYEDADIRKAAFIGVGDGTEIADGSRYVNKFYKSSRGGQVVDVKAIRTAEMYLIRAEANAELNNITEAAADLNLLRAQRIEGYSDESFSDKTLLIDAVMDERYKELCFEGFRFFDLKRRNLPMERNASDVDSPNWQNLPADNFRFIFPIPSDELLANRSMVQNPGYQ